MKLLLLYALTIGIAYMIGSSNLALYVSKLKGVDLRSGGSGNLGASNAMILMGWRFGILVAIHDILKAALAVILARHFLPELPYIGAVAGVSAVLGHMFPFYLRFKGGKGFASYLGMTMALNWKLALAICLIVLLVTWITDYIVVGTVTTVVLVPAYMGFTASLFTALILLAATLPILYKHRFNYVRIYKGTEIGLRRAHRGDDRKN